jgi:hypothetical protein
LIAVLAVPFVASADEPERDRPSPAATTVEECSNRAAMENPRLDGFLDELVTDNVISADQADEIAARFDAKHFNGCVASILFDRGTVIEGTANVTGTENREVLGAIVAGQSLSEYANEHGVDDATLIDAIMAGPEAKAAELVAGGEISQEDVDGILAKIEERVTDGIYVTDATPRHRGGVNRQLGDQL